MKNNLKNWAYNRVTKTTEEIEVKAPQEQCRECNICSRTFVVKNKFSRFCSSCRLESEIYRIAEWLPTTNISRSMQH